MTATGTFALINGEPVIKDAVLSPQGTQGDIRPFAMSNRNIGGAPWLSSTWIQDFHLKPTMGWTMAGGASNVGLLVTTCGTVKSTCQNSTDATKWLYIDDGSEIVTDWGEMGVLVYTDAEVQMGDKVSVTGVSSTEPSIEDPTRLVRVVRMRDAADVQVLARVENHWEYPFSDEFDSPTADPRWLLIPGTGSIEVDGTQGCLKLTYIPPLPNQTAIMPKAIQFAPGDWVMDMCVQFPAHPTDLTRDEYLPGVLISLNKQCTGTEPPLLLHITAEPGRNTWRLAHSTTI